MGEFYIVFIVLKVIIVNIIVIEYFFWRIFIGFFIGILVFRVFFIENIFIDDMIRLKEWIIKGNKIKFDGFV